MECVECVWSVWVECVGVKCEDRSFGVCGWKKVT